MLLTRQAISCAGSEEGSQGYMSAASGFADAAAPSAIGGGAPTGSAGSSAAPRVPLPQASVFISNPFEGAWSIRGSGEHGGPTLASSHGSGAQLISLVAKLPSVTALTL